MSRNKSYKETDILLVHPPPYKADRPPLGIATISAYLRKNGIKTKVLDINVDLYHQLPDNLKFLFEMDTQEMWINLKKVKSFVPDFSDLLDNYVDEILKYNTKIIGFSVSNPKEYFTIELIRKIREKDKDKLIIVGGNICTTRGISGTPGTRSSITCSIPSLNNFVFVVGEGEHSILEITTNMKKGKKLRDIPGIIPVKNGRELYYRQRPLISNLDNIGYPNYKEFDLSKYTTKSLEIEWSRGCIANCIFCIVRTMQGKYRSKGVRKRYEEIKYLYNNFNVDTFSICDSVINGNLKQLEEFCDLIIKSGLKIKWSGQVTPRKEMTQELYTQMRKAGCYRLEFGIESGADTVLKNMNKLFDAQTAEKNIKLCKKADIMTVIYLLIGFPGETEQDFSHTLSFLERNYDFIDLVRSFRQLYVQPGTYIFDNLDKYGIIKDPKDILGNKWYTLDGNTYESRTNRLKRVQEKIKELGIKGELTDLEKSIIK